MLKTLKIIIAAFSVSVPMMAFADAVDDFTRVWQAAIAPADEQGGVVLSGNVSVEGCRLTYEFTSNGGTVTDSFKLPLAQLNVEMTGQASSAPTSAGVVFVLDSDALGETTKTFANGTTRSRETPYGSLFPENFASDAAALGMLDALFEVANQCRETGSV